MEATNMKLKEAEQAKDVDDRLAHNRSNIRVILVDMGLDDRTNTLHDGRFLPGANCSAAKLWLAARSRIPQHVTLPLGNYDMASVGFVPLFLHRRHEKIFINPVGYGLLF